MTGDMWIFLGVVLGALLTFLGVVKTTRTTTQVQGRSASADEVESLGNRLDSQTKRIDELERTLRTLREYVADDHAEHRRNGWPIMPLPKDIA